jgi:hypothetical protein
VSSPDIARQVPTDQRAKVRIQLQAGVDEQAIDFAVPGRTDLISDGPQRLLFVGRCLAWKDVCSRRSRMAYRSSASISPAPAAWSMRGSGRVPIIRGSARSGIISRLIGALQELADAPGLCRQLGLAAQDRARRFDV